jgi:hypothetical protein
MQEVASLERVAQEVKKIRVGHGPRIYELNLDLVEQLAANGLTDQQIAAFFGMSLLELRKKKKVSEMLDRALATGQAKGVAKVANKLFLNATVENNLIAQIFYLKARGGWREADKLPQEDDTAERIKVYLPSNRREK